MSTSDDPCAKTVGYAPIDILSLVYSFLVLACILIGWREVPHNVGWLLFYLAYFGIVFSFRRVPRRLPAPLQFLRDAHPLLTLGPHYLALADVNRAFYDVYFDDWVIAWDRAWFGGHPNEYLAAALPWAPLSEFLHFCYYFYLWLVPLLGLTLLLQKRYEAFRITATSITAVFFFCYTIFLFFPVQGPWYTFAHVDAPGQYFPALVYATLERGAAVGTAFPSSHCSAATVIAIMAIRFSRRLSFFVVPIAVGIVFATMYGGFHYAIDSAAGLGIGLLFGWLGPKYYTAMTRRLCRR